MRSVVVVLPCPTAYSSVSNFLAEQCNSPELIVQIVVVVSCSLVFDLFAWGHNFVSTDFHGLNLHDWCWGSRKES
jgi:hypothetical protein